MIGEKPNLSHLENIPSYQHIVLCMGQLTDAGKGGGGDVG
jgi:hypothetical protein